MQFLIAFPILLDKLELLQNPKKQWESHLD